MGEPGTIVVTTSQRSSVHSARVNMSNTVAACFELAGAEVEVGDGYPGWAMNPDSEILHIAKETYRELFGKEPKVLGIHAGLECGLFSEKYPALDMISFGPTLRGVHSPEERLYIPSVEPVWNHLLAILERIPEKK
jgi:dipeptidase D